MLSEGMIVGGEEIGAEAGERVQVLNPADTREVVGTVPLGTKDDARRAVEVAQAAFETNKWSSIYESRYRGSVLWQIARLVEQNRASLASTLTLEQGKPLEESMVEITSFANCFDYYAGFGGKIEGKVFYSTSRDTRYELKEVPHPVGVCVAIPPWNFPVSLLGWKLAPALMAGNAVVVKPSITTPLATIEVVKLINKAGLPSGILNLVTGPSSEVGKELVTHPDVRRVAFTGSTETGKKILAQSSNQIKYITLELGGSDPTIIADDADLEAATNMVALNGRYRNCGQSCTSIKRLYVFDKVADEVEKMMVEKVGTIRLGRGDVKGVQMGPLHTEHQREEIESLVEDAKGRGARVLAGAERPNGEDFSHGFFYKPTLLADVPESARVWTEESFGPVLPIQRVGGLDEAIEAANSSSYGLGATIWSKSAANLEKFERQVESGMVWENSGPTPLQEVAFGGVKESGVGRELGFHGLLEYLEVKSIRKAVS